MALDLARNVAHAVDADGPEAFGPGVVGLVDHLAYLVAGDDATGLYDAASPATFWEEIVSVADRYQYKALEAEIPVAAE